MFIRQVKKKAKKSNNTFCQYNLVQAARVEGKIKQRVILYLGSHKELADKNNRQAVLQILKAKIFRQPELFPADVPASIRELALSYYEKYLIKYGQPQEQPAGETAEEVSLPPDSRTAEFHNTDISGLEVSHVKSFGSEHLCTQVLDKLKLADCFGSLGMEAQQVRKALIAIAARAIFTASEHKTAQMLERNSELAACLGHHEPITHKQLYAVADKLFAHKEAIDDFLYQRITNMFDIEDKLVIYDISNTYFETTKAGSRLARHGRSKEKRNDCPLVIFTGVVNAQGFIRHSRIYEGSRADPKTLADMVADMEAHSNATSKKTVVMDAGIATEDNLSLLAGKGYDYVCVSRKRLKDHLVSEQGRVLRSTDRGRHEVKLSVFRPEDQGDTWMYVQSDLKSRKEQSMSEKLTGRFEQDLQAIREGLSKKGGTKKVEKVRERIGRVKQKHNRVSHGYRITLSQKEGKATDIQWQRESDPVREDKEQGVYFIRTSYKDPSEGELWDVYNTIREVEATFRCLKTDLQIRPVYHRKDERIESHLYLTLLAYQLVNTIRHMLKQQGIHHDWRNILTIMDTHTIQTIEIPTDKKTIHLRKPSKPIEEVRQIYKATGCTETQKPVKKYVVYH